MCGSTNLDSHQDQVPHGHWLRTRSHLSKKVEKHDLETLVAQEPVSLQTANGVTDTDLVSTFQTESFKEPINPYVLGDAPSVLSVGKRCMKQRYGFVWPPGRDPFMIDPDGKRISLFVNGDIPYIRAGSQKSCAHEDVEATAFKNIFTRREDSSTDAAQTAAVAMALLGEIDGEEGGEVVDDIPPDPEPHEVQSS